MGFRPRAFGTRGAVACAPTGFAHLVFPVSGTTTTGGGGAGGSLLLLEPLELLDLLDMVGADIKLDSLLPLLEALEALDTLGVLGLGLGCLETISRLGFGSGRFSGGLPLLTDERLDLLLTDRFGLKTFASACLLASLLALLVLSLSLPLSLPLPLSLSLASLDLDKEIDEARELNRDGLDDFDEVDFDFEVIELADERAVGVLELDGERSSGLSSSSSIGLPIRVSLYLFK